MNEYSKLLPNYVTVSQLAERIPGFSESGIRFQLFNRETNGLHAHVIKVGRKVLIDERGFMAWLDGQR